MKKRILASILAGTLIAGLMAGCSTQSSGGGTSTVASKPEEQATLTVWEHTPQYEETLNILAEEFMKQNPNIKVNCEIKTPDQYYNLLATTIQAGETPDLFWTNGNATTNFPGYVQQDVVMDLTEKVDFSQFSEGAMKLVSVDGKVYSTPGATADTRAVFYNKDIFEKFSLTVPTNFDEFEKCLQTIQENDIVPLALGGRFTWSILFHFEPMLAAMAPDWLEEMEQGTARVDDPRFAAVIDKMIEWGEKGYYGPGYLGVDEAGQLLAFSKQEAAMTITGAWNADTFKKNNPDLNFGAFQLPTKDGKRPMITTFSAGFCVAKNTKYPDAAIKFAQFLVSQEGQQIWVDATSSVPGLSSVISKNEIIAELSTHDLERASFYDLLGVYSKEDGNPRQIWEEDNVKLLSGSVTTQDFIKSLDAVLK